VSAITEAANIITRWPALLGPDALPPKLLAAIRLFDESEFVQPPPPPAVPEVTSADKLASASAELARELSTAEHFEAATRQVRDHLGQEVISLAHQNIDAVFDAIRPGFQAAADSFVAAVCELPETLNLSSGSVAVANYEQAKDAHGQLEKLDSFLSSLTVLYGGRPEPALRCLKPVNRDDFQSITDRQGSRKAYEGLHDHWAWAARNQVVFEPHTPPQCAEIRAAIQAQPVERKPFKMADTVRAAPVNRI
jgi:hypothetical protein